MKTLEIVEKQNFIVSKIYLNSKFQLVFSFLKTHPISFMDEKVVDLWLLMLADF